METVIGLFKTECIRTTVFHSDPYRTIVAVEWAVASWIDWWNNRRLCSSLDDSTLGAFEYVHYAALNRELTPVYERHETRGASGCCACASQGH